MPEPIRKQVTVLVIKPDIVSEEGKVDEIIEKVTLHTSFTMYH